MMDMPVGRPVKEGIDTRKVDFRKLFPTLSEHQLSGYMALDIMTDNGMEEGLLLFHQGDIIASEYKYVAREKVVRGKEALPLFMNGCMGQGTFDVYELDDVVGVRERNRDDVLKYKPTKEEVEKLLPDTFVQQTLEEERRVKVEAEGVEVSGEVSKEDVLKKYGITHPDDRAVDELLKNIME